MSLYKIEQWMPNVGLEGSWEDILNDYAEADSAALAIELAKDYIIENLDENYLDEHDLTVEELAEEVRNASYRARKLSICDGMEDWELIEDPSTEFDGVEDAEVGRTFKVDETADECDQMKDTFRQYVNEYLGWNYGKEDVENDIKHDYLTEVATRDGKTFLHYLDEILEFVVLPGVVLDDENMKKYTKYIY